MQKGALMKQNTTAIYDVDTLNILSPDKIGLTETESGYLEFRMTAGIMKRLTLQGSYRSTMKTGI